MLYVYDQLLSILHWLALLGGHDHAMVDNIEYFISEDEYPPVSWDKWRVMGSTQLPIQEKQQIDRKIVMGAVKIAQFITDNDGVGTVGGFLTFNEVNELLEFNPRQFELFDPSDDDVFVSTPQSTTQDEFEQSQNN